MVHRRRHPGHVTWDTVCGERGAQGRCEGHAGAPWTPADSGTIPGRILPVPIRAGR